MPLRKSDEMAVNDVFGRPCPCGSGAGYNACCGPLHHGERHAVTAEELMRSRYSAYACGDADYLYRTWHPRTRPADVTVDPGVIWKSLEITDTAAGGSDDETGEVEFTAVFRDPAAVSGHRPAAMHERSRFERRAGRWFYVDGDPR
jgi:SEC-C motif-containing protein